MKQEALKVGWKCKDNKRQVPITGCSALKVAKEPRSESKKKILFACVAEDFSRVGGKGQ